jgi:hypothetical protein
MPPDMADVQVKNRQGRRKYQKIRRGGGGGGRFSRHTIPKLHVFDLIFLKNIEISKQKGNL